jgi:hypothetical protein
MRERAAAIKHVHLIGGGASEPGLVPELETVGFAVSVASEPRLAAVRAGLSLLPGAACVDVGQTSLKLAVAGDTWVIERDPVAAPQRDETAPEALAQARRSTIAFLAEGIARRLEGRSLVLALPCELSDDGVAAGCTYCWGQSDASLLRELADAAAVDWAALRILNDGELAGVAASREPSVPADQITLVLTIGFGVGAALLEAA